MGPLCGTDTGLNATECCAVAAAVSPLPPPPLLLLAFGWSGASGLGFHSNSPTAPLALPPKLRVTVPGPPVGGGLAGLNGAVGADSSCRLRVAWWMGSARY